MNQVYTAGYLMHRLKDAGFIVWKIFNSYGEGDCRKWTILIDPGYASIYITCYLNKPLISGYSFLFDDGGEKFDNFYIQTDSAEVILKTLIDRGVSNDPTHSKYYKEHGA